MPNLQRERDGAVPRYAGDIRVSTTDQAQEGYSLEAQRNRITAHADDGELVHIYCDAGISGRRDDRPNRLASLAAAEAGEFDKLVIIKLDRFGRSARQLQENFERLDRAGVELVSLSESIDTSTPTGRLLRNVLAALAEFEGDVIGERVRSVNRERIE